MELAEQDLESLRKLGKEFSLILNDYILTNNLVSIDSIYLFNKVWGTVAREDVFARWAQGITGSFS